MKLNYNVKKEDNKKTLKDILKRKLYISNILLNKLKLTNSIFVNNISKHTNYILSENDVITIDFNNMNKVIYEDKSNLYYKDKKYLDKYKSFNFDLNILYEDDYILIVNKPANMAIHPSCANYDTTLSNAVATYLKNQNIYSIHIVTRLDKDTSGICIFAKNEYIQELFIRKKEVINLKKEYIAIVNGIVEKQHEIIERNISRKANSIIVREVNTKGNYAKTEYFVKKRNYHNNYTVINVILHTGRTHQIRVHMASIGHVLIGDELYSKEYNVNDINKLINRQALHSSKISFIHPITGEKINLTASLPQDMKNLI